MQYCVVAVHIHGLDGGRLGEWHAGNGAGASDGRAQCHARTAADLAADDDARWVVRTILARLHRYAKHQMP